MKTRRNILSLGLAAALLGTLALPAPQAHAGSKTNRFVAGALLGGALGYIIGDSRNTCRTVQVVHAPPPVVYHPAPVIVHQPVVYQPAPVIVHQPVVYQPAPVIVHRPVVCQPAPVMHRSVVITHSRSSHGGYRSDSRSRGRSGRRR